MANPWMKFYPGDYRSDPGLRTCSLAARGLWVEMLCLMHEAGRVGTLTVNGRQIDTKALAGLCGVGEREVKRGIAELENAGIFSRESDGTIYSRRMLRDVKNTEKNKINGKNGGGNPEIRRGSVAKQDRVRPFKRSDAPAKTNRIFERSNGCCHWCGVELDRSDELKPNTFHVDHVVAVCDGGTNDEENLVAACAACNHGRARINFRPQPPTATGQIPTLTQNDSLRQQSPEARSQKLERKKEPSQEGGDDCVTRSDARSRLTTLPGGRS